jgi:hypothetical protein
MDDGGRALRVLVVRLGPGFWVLNTENVVLKRPRYYLNPAFCAPIDPIDCFGCCIGCAFCAVCIGLGCWIG